MILDNLITAVATAAPFVAKSILEIKARKKENKTLLDSLRENTRTSKEVKDNFEAFQKDHDFRGQFKTVVENKAILAASNSKMNNSLSAVLIDVSKELADIGMSFYYSKVRNRPYEIHMLLDVRFNALESNIYTYVKNVDEQKLTLISGKERMVYLSSMFDRDKSTIYQKTGALLSILKINGFQDTEAFENIFMVHVANICNEFTDIVQKWKDIKEYHA